MTLPAGRCSWYVRLVGRAADSRTRTQEPPGYCSEAGAGGHVSSFFLLNLLAARCDVAYRLAPRPRSAPSPVLGRLLAPALVGWYRLVMSVGAPDTLSPSSVPYSTREKPPPISEPARTWSRLTIAWGQVTHASNSRKGKPPVIHSFERTNQNAGVEQPCAGSGDARMDYPLRL